MSNTNRPEPQQQPSSEPNPPGAVTPPLDVEESGLTAPLEDTVIPPPPPPPFPQPTSAGRVPAPPRDRRRHATPWSSTDVLRTAALVVAMYLALRLLWFASALVLTAFLGTLFGLAVSAGAERLERFGLRKGIAAAVVVVGFLGVLVGFFAIIGPTLREQGGELRQKLPQAVDRVEEWLQRHQNGLLATALQLPARADSTASGLKAAQPATPVAPAAGPSQPRDQHGAPSATETLRERLGGQLSGLSRYLFPFLSSTLAALAGVLLIIFLSIYIGGDTDSYHRGLMMLFPVAARPRAGEVLSAVATVLRKWLVTQLIAMLVIGTVSTVALLIVGVKAAFALGLLAGLFEFIPTVGPILSAVPAIAMGFLDSPEKALTVAAIYIGVQFLENHILIPMLMRGGLDLPPALTILGQALFTLLFGFIGLMVAVPALAAIVVVVRMLYVEGVVGEPEELAAEVGAT